MSMHCISAVRDCCLCSNIETVELRTLTAFSQFGTRVDNRHALKIVCMCVCVRACVHAVCVCVR